MVKNIIYYISIISFILITFLTEEMLLFIFQSSIQGIIYLISIFLLLITELYFLIIEKRFIKNSYIYNCLIILITMYISVIYYRIYTYNVDIYEIDIRYLKYNYLIISVILILIIINLFYKKYKKIK